MIAPATSSLHWPTKVRPSDKAANELSSRVRSVSTMVEMNIYWSSDLDLPA